jgi:hypothetical protein
MASYISPSVDHLKAASRLCDACLRQGLRFSYDGHELLFHLPVPSDEGDLLYVPCYAVIGGPVPNSIEHLDHLIAAVEGL